MQTSTCSGNEAAMPGAPAQPSVIRVVRQSFAACYDHLGLAVAVNFAVSLMLAPVVIWWLAPVRGWQSPFPAVFGAVIRSAVVLVLAAVFASGLLEMAKSMVDRSEVAFTNVFRGIGANWLISLKFGALNALVLIVIALDMLYLAASESWMLRTGAVVLGYLSILWVLSQIYQLPLLLEKRRSVLWGVKQSVLLVLDNPLFTLGIAAVIMVSVWLSAAIRLPLILWLPVWISVLQRTALRELLRKYEALQQG
ncbi:MAG: hypothetical protein ACP5R4_01345 [Armatimonadota bacterium]